MINLQYATYRMCHTANSHLLEYDTTRIAVHEGFPPIGALTKDTRSLGTREDL